MEAEKRVNRFADNEDSYTSTLTKWTDAIAVRRRPAMAKSSGGSRAITPGSKNYKARLGDFKEKMMSGDYSEGYFSDKSGGYYLVEKSSAEHSDEEVEAAKILADKGYIVKLKDEGGNMSTPDGEVFSYTYEQRTPDKASGPNGVMKCIEHATKKVHKKVKIDVSLIYDKHRRFTKSDIEQGIKLYEQYNRRTRFKQIIVVSPSGRVHRHKHND